jgi:hypothetical protein
MGDTAAAASYTAQLKTLKEAYHAEYYNEKSGDYNGGSKGAQTSNLLPLYLDIPPTDEIKAKVGAAFVAALEKNNNRTTSGIVGTAYTLQVLRKIGRNDLALQMASEEAKPSWGYMVIQVDNTYCVSWTTVLTPAFVMITDGVAAGTRHYLGDMGRYE